MGLINRTPWSALVDDDGTNTTGTPWTKDKIKTVILDPADAAYSGAVALTSGNWTPTITSSGGGAPTYSAQDGQYIRIGALVHVSCRLALATKGTLAAGLLSMQGLPFIVAVVGSANFVGAIHFNNLATNWISLFGLASSGSTGVILQGSKAAGISTTTGLVDTDIAGNAVFNWNCVYRTSAP